MKSKWLIYSGKYKQLTMREQYLILVTGLATLFFMMMYLLIDPVLLANKEALKSIQQLSRSNQSMAISVTEIKHSLKSDPNLDIQKQIKQFEKKLAKIDSKLLELTSDLIDPIQMRYALLELLSLEQGVRLVSFELLGAQPLLSVTAESKNDNDSANQAHEINQQNLYRHGIKIKLSGGYFELQSYLKQLEQIKWHFFWQSFDFKVMEYPENELEIIIYSLSTKRGFVGV